MAPTPEYNFSPFEPKIEKIDIEYVAANPSSREIFCRLHNTGTVDLELVEVRVNGSVVKVKDPLPLPVNISDYGTCVITYDGPWEGLIPITLDTGSPFRKHETLVDLQTPSRNPIEGAYYRPPEPGPLENFFHQNYGIIHLVGYWGSIVMIVVVIALLALEICDALRSSPESSFSRLIPGLRP